MTNTTVSNPLNSDNNPIEPGDIIGSSIANWCYGYVIRRGVSGGRVSGYYIETIVDDETGLTGRVEFIPDEFATLICGAVAVTVTEDVTVAAVTNPGHEYVIDVTVEPELNDRWEVARLAAKRDSPAMTSRIIGDELANDAENINTKLSAYDGDNTISGYLERKSWQDTGLYQVGSDK